MSQTESSVEFNLVELLKLEAERVAVEQKEQAEASLRVAKERLAKDEAAKAAKLAQEAQSQEEVAAQQTARLRKQLRARAQHEIAVLRAQLAAQAEVDSKRHERQLAHEREMASLSLRRRSSRWLAGLSAVLVASWLSVAAIYLGRMKPAWALAEAARVRLETELEETRGALQVARGMLADPRHGSQSTEVGQPMDGVPVAAGEALNRAPRGRSTRPNITRTLIHRRQPNGASRTPGLEGLDVPSSDPLEGLD